MGDLVLKGRLNLMGNLTLAANGGKVMVGSKAALVQLQAPADPAHCTSAAPVIIPPPPGGPVDSGPKVWVILSFNPTVKIKTAAGSKAIVAQGMAMQGNVPTWPGMVLPSTGNPGPGVSINHLPINVEGDMAVIFPSGGSASLSSSGQ